MPYIKQEAKEDLHYLQPRNVGELTYRLTVIALSDNHYSDKYNDMYYAVKQYWEGGEQKFQRHAEVLGALEAARGEIGRRLDCCSTSTGVIADAKWALKAVRVDYYQNIVAPYENDKIRANGDVKEIAALISMPRIDIGP